MIPHVEAKTNNIAMFAGDCRGSSDKSGKGNGDRGEDGQRDCSHGRRRTERFRWAFTQINRQKQKTLFDSTYLEALMTKLQHFLSIDVSSSFQMQLQSMCCSCIWNDLGEEGVERLIRETHIIKEGAKDRNKFQRK